MRDDSLNSILITGYCFALVFFVVMCYVIFYAS